MRPPGPEPLLIAADVRWDRFTGVMSARRPRALYRSLIGPDTSSPTDTSPTNGTPERDAVLALPELARAAVVGKTVAAAAERALGHDENDPIREDEGLFELGMDLMSAVDVLAELSALYAVRLQAVDIFDHPTITALAALVVSRLADAPVTASASAPPPGVAPAPNQLPM